MIDGYNIRHHVNKCDWSHGGQFGEYRKKVTSFFNDLIRCGLHPIVVLDGIDYTGKKWSTTMRREKERIRQIHKEISGEDRKSEVRSQNVFPALAADVYVNVLVDLRVEFVMVDGEADDTLVEIANYYKCPVLSSDSDFYMYNLDGGYIPMEKLNLSTYPITAEVYHYQDFCAQFKFVSDSVRLIIPALVGNDFWSAMTLSESFEDFLAEEIEVLDGNSQSLRSITQFASLFDSLDSFIYEVKYFPYLRDGWKSKLIENCQQSGEIYNSDKKLQISDIRDVTVLRSFEGEPVPLWVLRNFREGNFSKFMINSLVLNKYVLSTFIDDTTNERSCILISRPIRRNIYQILGCRRVAEHFRMEKQLSSEEVHSHQSVPSLPSLEDIPEISHPKRANLLYSILGCDWNVFWELDSKWRLVLAATVFWYRESHPPPHIVRSLLLCFVICCHPAVIQRRLTASAEFRRSSGWLGCLHSFAQWQSCYKDAISLDQVLMLPLTVTCPSQIYSGKLAMYFAMPRNYDDYMSSYGHKIDRIFWKFLNIVCPEEVQHRSSRYPAPYQDRSNGRSSKYVAPQRRQQPRDRVMGGTPPQQPQCLQWKGSRGSTQRFDDRERRCVDYSQENWRDASNDRGFEPVSQQHRDRVVRVQQHTGRERTVQQQDSVQRPLGSHSQNKSTASRWVACGSEQKSVQPKPRERTRQPKPRERTRQSQGQRSEEEEDLSRDSERQAHCTTASQPRGYSQGNPAAQYVPARSFGEHGKCGEHRSEYRLLPGGGEQQQSQHQYHDATRSRHDRCPPPPSSQRGAKQHQPRKVSWPAQKQPHSRVDDQHDVLPRQKQPHKYNCLPQQEPLPQPGRGRTHGSSEAAASPGASGSHSQRTHARGRGRGRGRGRANATYKKASGYKGN